MIVVRPVEDKALLPGYERIAAKVRYGWRSEKLWFDVPQNSAHTDNQTGNHWLLAFLPPAFERGETLRIELPVDAQLLENTQKLQAIWTGWFPERKPVEVQVKTTSAATSAARPHKGKTGLFFTGGVDSFFSLLHFDAVSSGKIDDLIYVWGFDIPLSNPAAFEGKMTSLKQVAELLGKNVITVITNLRQTRLRKIDWGMRMHGPAIGAVGLLFDRRWEKILFSSSRTRHDSEPWGSHFLTTSLMSSSCMRFIEYGTEFDRFEKTREIAKSEVALQHLHVCWREGSEKNCGRCEKCYRTLLLLELLGVRERAASFPQNDFSLEYTKQIRLSSGLMVPLFAEVKAAAKLMSRPDVEAAVEACLQANTNSKR
jgi:hypothetical protein